MLRRIRLRDGAQRGGRDPHGVRAGERGRGEGGRLGLEVGAERYHAPVLAHCDEGVASVHGHAARLLPEVRHPLAARVYDASEGQVLRVGPAHVAGTAAPGGSGNSVLAGHRDTHFRFLGDLATGDALWLETPSGLVRRYRVRGAFVVHESDLWPLEPAAEPMLTLITCFPFDAVAAGGPLRYVVRAEAP